MPAAYPSALSARLPLPQRVGQMPVRMRGADIRAYPHTRIPAYPHTHIPAYTHAHIQHTRRFPNVNMQLIEEGPDKFVPHP